MAINQQSNDIFAPPTPEELDSPSEGELGGGGTGSNTGASIVPAPTPDLFAPPTKQELQAVPDVKQVDMFAPPEPQEYQKLSGEMNRGIVEDIRKSPLLGSQSISPQEIDTIAQKHGVSPDKLKSVAPFLGAEKEWQDLEASDIPKAVAGQLGLVTFGLPQKIYKSFQSPQEEQAMDDLQELARARSSNLSGFARAVALPGVSLSKTAGIGAKAAVGGAQGALAGVGASREGEALQGAAIGGAGGAILGGALGKLEQKLAARGARQEAEALQRVTQDLDLSPVEKEIIPAARAADDALEASLTRELSPQDYDAIAQQYVQKQDLEKLLDRSTPEGERFYSRLNKQAPEAVRDLGTERAAEQFAKKELVDQFRSNKIQDLARDLLRRPVSQEANPEELVRDYLLRQGEDYTRSRFRGLLNESHVQDYIQKNAVRARGAQNLAERAADFLSDAQYVVRGMDEKIGGLGAEDGHKALVSGYNRMTIPRADAQKQLQRIYSQLSDSGLDSVAEDGGKLIEKLERPGFKVTDLTQEEAKVYDQFAQYFENLREYANTRQGDIAPLSLARRENYVPAMLMDSGRLTRTLERRVQEVLNRAEELYKKPIRDLAQLEPGQLAQLEAGSPDTKSTLQFIRNLSGNQSQDPSELSRLYKETFLTRTGKVKLEAIARASLEREDLLPMWARETNLYRLGDKYATNTLRAMYLRQPLDQLRAVSNKLTSIGMDAESSYIDNLLADIQGVRKGTVAEGTMRAYQALTNKLDDLAERTDNPVARATFKTLRGMPMLLDAAARNVYGNYLGLNARGLIQNSTQTITKTIPEFGNVYGNMLALRGGIWMKGTGGLKRAEARLQQLGLAPSSYTQGGKPYLAEGLMRSRGYRAASKLNEGVVNAMMYAYQKMEIANRAVALSMSEMMADDLVRNSGRAVDVLRRFPSSVQQSAQQAILEGNKDFLVKELATHIINNTQYQYNRPAMSEFGRTMGPLFSTFSKWPAATFGDIVERFRSKGITDGTRNVMEKYIAPLLLLEGVDRLVLGQKDGQFENVAGNDRTQKLFGASGLSTAAPIGTLKSIAQGDFFTPPAVDIFLKSIALPVLQGDTTTLSGGLANAAYSFAPLGLGGITRFLTDDLQTLSSGYRPEGKNLIERTQTGARRLGD